MNRVAGLGQPVVRELPLTGDLDEFCHSEHGEVARDGGLREVENFDDIADAQLTGGEQTQDAEPGRVGERLEEGVNVRNGRSRRSSSR